MSDPAPASASASASAISAGHRKVLEWLESSAPKRMLIGGKWVDAVSGKTFETINPSTEERLAYVAEADSADVDAAVAAARRAFESASSSGSSPQSRTRSPLKIAGAGGSE